MSGTGTIYLLHFMRPFGHARHYLGWSDNLSARLDRHASGNGARLLAAAYAVGVRWRLARVWEGPRARERQIKRQGGLSRSCPLCGVIPRRRDRGLNLAALQRFAAYAAVPEELDW